MKIFIKGCLGGITCTLIAPDIAMLRLFICSIILSIALNLDEIWRD